MGDGDGDGMKMAMAMVMATSSIWTTIGMGRWRGYQVTIRQTSCPNWCTDAPNVSYRTTRRMTSTGRRGREITWSVREMMFFEIN